MFKLGLSESRLERKAAQWQEPSGILDVLLRLGCRKAENSGS